MLTKEELLAAIAAAGSAGRQAYERAQQRLQEMQAEAVRQALASTIMAGAPAGAGEQIASTVSAPYQRRAAQLTQDQAASEDWFNRLSASRAPYMDALEHLGQIAFERALAEALVRRTGGGGSADEPPTWEDVLSDQFGTVERGFDVIGLQARKEKLPGEPRYMAAKRIATGRYGVPSEVAAVEFPPSPFQLKAETYKPTLRNFKRLVLKARETPGSQALPLRIARERLPARAQEKAKRYQSRVRRMSGR